MPRDADVTFTDYSTIQQDSQIGRLIADAAQSDFEDFSNEKCREAYDQGYDGERFAKPELSTKIQGKIADDYLSDVEEILQKVAKEAYDQGQSDATADNEDTGDEAEED